MLASLPWYDLAENRTATDAFWNLVANELRNRGLEQIPERLERVLPYQEQWASPDFLFGQACGYDVLLAYPDLLQLVATPTYSAPGCRTAAYSSYVVVREQSPFSSLDQLRGTRCVVNTLTSHSGMNILRALIAPLHDAGRFFAEVSVSGSHKSSLEMLLVGAADVAAIDCVTYALFQRHRPETHRGTRILCSTVHVPSPPFVTSTSTPPDVVVTIREALQATLADPSSERLRARLLLDRVDWIPLDAYRRIADIEQLANDFGYHEISGHLV